MSRLIKGLALLMVGGIMALFLMLNAQWVVVRVPRLSLDWSRPLSSVEYETPLAVGLALAFALGALLVLMPTWLRRAVERQRERRFIGDLQGELTDLRNLPLTHPAPLEDVPEPHPEADAQPQEAADADDDEDERLLMAALQGEGQKRQGPRR
jgi:hypothetical protein